MIAILALLMLMMTWELWLTAGNRKRLDSRTPVIERLEKNDRDILDRLKNLERRRD